MKLFLNVQYIFPFLVVADPLSGTMFIFKQLQRTLLDNSIVAVIMCVKILIIF